MKSFLLALILISAQVQAEIKKESWSCEDQGAILSAEFSRDGISATINETEEVSLSFSYPNQKSALNGSQKTFLKGRWDSWDHVNYTVTLIRPRAEYAAAIGPAYETYEATAIVELDGDYDCGGRYQEAKVFKCQVKVYR